MYRGKAIKIVCVTFLFYLLGGILMAKRTLPVKNVLNLRLSDETAKKLNYTATVSGLSKSAAARKFIEDGEVKIFYGSKEIIRKMSKAESNLNSYCLHVLKEIDDVRKDLNILKWKLSYGDNFDLLEPPFSIVLDAEKKLNSLEGGTRSTHANSSKELTDCVNLKNSTQS